MSRIPASFRHSSWAAILTLLTATTSANAQRQKTVDSIADPQPRTEHRNANSPGASEDNQPFDFSGEWRANRMWFTLNQSASGVVSGNFGRPNQPQIGQVKGYVKDGKALLKYSTPKGTGDIEWQLEGDSNAIARWRTSQWRRRDWEGEYVVSRHGRASSRATESNPAQGVAQTQQSATQNHNDVGSTQPRRGSKALANNETDAGPASSRAVRGAANKDSFAELKDASFTVSFPSEPEQGRTGALDKASDMVIDRWSTESSKNLSEACFEVQSMQFGPEHPWRSASADEHFELRRKQCRDGVRGGAAKIGSQYDYRQVANRSVTVQGYPGVLSEFAADSGDSGRVRFSMHNLTVVAGARVYFVSVLRVFPAAGASHVSDVKVKQFINSFRLKQPAPPAESAANAHRDTTRADGTNAGTARLVVQGAPVDDKGLAGATLSQIKVGDSAEVGWKGAWYKATVLEIQNDGRYLIHYDGWSDKWNEVVERDRIRGLATNADAVATSSQSGYRGPNQDSFATSGAESTARNSTSENAVRDLRQARKNSDENVLARAIGYYTGTIGRVDVAKAKELFTKASKAGDPLATMWTAVCLNAGDCGFPEDKPRARQVAASVIDEVVKSSYQGDSNAMLLHGLALSAGLGLEENLEASIEWFRKAAELGNASAQNNLGLYYALGIGVDQDFSEAVKWHRKAAAQGYALAQSNLGWAYYRGNGVGQDFTLAVEWFRKAAEMGNANAQNNLGVCYAIGKGVEQDATQSAEWYRRAAEQGEALAQNNLGACYERGFGVDQDYAQAVQWYRKAATQGLADAQSNLARLNRPQQPSSYPQQSNNNYAQQQAKHYANQQLQGAQQHNLNQQRAARQQQAKAQEQFRQQIYGQKQW